MKIYFVFIIVCCIATFSTSVSAQHNPNHGTWYCQDCNSQDQTPIASGDAISFIRTVVNGNSGYTSAVGSTWQPGDTVTLCDGTMCYTYKFVVSAWQYTLVRTRDTQHQYQNQGDYHGGTGGSDSSTGARGGAGGGGGSGYQPIYTVATVCAGGVCTTQWVITGYQRIAR